MNTGTIFVSKRRASHTPGLAIVTLSKKEPPIPELPKVAVPWNDLSPIVARTDSAFGSDLCFHLTSSLRGRWQSYTETHRLFLEKRTEESVHNLRIASRKLMAQLDLLISILPGRQAERTRYVLKRRMKALGRLRDLQVQRMHFKRHLNHFPELILICDFLEKRENRLTSAAVAAVRGIKIKRLEKWISRTCDQLLEEKQAPDRQPIVGSEIIRAVENGFSAVVVGRRQAIDARDLQTIHRTRIAFKKFRYMIESLSPHFTGFDRRQLRTLASYQRKMGAIQDFEIIQSCVAAFIRKYKASEDLLGPFTRHVQQRRTRTICSFIRTADQIFTFWPDELTRQIAVQSAA